ncbi:MAG: hypothetical protein ABI128_09320 [Rhodanobacter sp.]
MSPRSLPGLLLIAGLLAGCGNASVSEFGSSVIANGAITVKHDKVTLRVADAPTAIILADGTLRVDSKTVSTDAAQRELLKQYYVSAAAVREHGIETGKAGVALAGESVKSALASALGSDEDKSNERSATGPNKVVQAAMKICLDLANIRTAQDGLAAQLPAFKPYAGIIGPTESGRCRKD